MAVVGRPLPKPDTGWKRYDDTDKNISYSGKEWTVYSNPAYYNNARHESGNSVENSKIKFNFIGSKLILISSIYPGYSNKIEINIDNKIVEHFSQDNSEGINQAVCYIKTGLEYKEHFVEITKINKGSYFVDFILDAIDIDENGELKPYNDKLYSFLLKQNNQYYTIKPEYYSNGQFQPLTLEGGEQPNENDYENFGFDDVNDLLISQNTKTIKGIDKGELGEGKCFEIGLDNEIKKINNIE